MYWPSLFRRSFNDTWDLVIGQPIWSVLIALAVFFVAFRIRRAILGGDAVKEAIPDAVFGVLAVVVTMAVVLLIHLLVISPARMYREKEAERAALANQIIKDRAHLVQRSGRIAFVQLPNTDKGLFLIRTTYGNVGKSGAIDLDSDLFLVHPNLADRPLIHKKGSSSNEIIHDTYLGVNSDPVQFTKNDPEYFVAVSIAYTDVASQQRRRQWFYSKFGGTNEIGNFLDALWGVSTTEKKALDDYFQNYYPAIAPPA